MQGIIRTGTVNIGGKTFFVADDHIIRRRLYPESNYQVQRDENRPLRGDLNPAILTYEIRDFYAGMGIYIDDGQSFSRTAWFSTLNHMAPDLTVIADRRQAAGEFPSNISCMLVFRSKVYALSTSNGLFEFNTGTNTFQQTAGSPIQAMTHACIQDKYMVIAGGSANSLILFDGTAFTTPAGAEKALRVASMEGKIFSVRATDATTNLVYVYYSDDLGVTWLPAIYNIGFIDATTGLPTVQGIQSAYDPRGVTVAPNSVGIQSLYVAVPRGVYTIDYRTGICDLFHDMSGDVNQYNGTALCYWPSTRSLYVNQKANLIEINLQNGTAQPVGPDPQTLPKGLPNGLPTGFKAKALRSVTFNGNYLFVGTTPATSTDYSVIMRMSPDHRWQFVQRHYVINRETPAMVCSDIGGNRLYFAEETTAGQPTARYLDFGGDFAEEGQVETPWLTMGFKDIDKSLISLILDADQLTSTEYITVTYRLNYDELTDYTFTAFNGASTRPLQRHFGSYPTNVGVSGRAIKFIVKMNRNPSDVTKTPRLFNIVLNYRLKPPPLYTYDMDLLVEPNTVDDFLAMLWSFLEDDTTTFLPDNDQDDTPIVVVATAQQDALSYEQVRKTGRVHLSLVQATNASVGGVCGIPHNHEVDPFTGNGVQTVFVLAYAPTRWPIVQVGSAIKIPTTDYSYSGTSLTFVSAPANLAKIYVHYVR